MDKLYRQTAFKSISLPELKTIFYGNFDRFHILLEES